MATCVIMFARVVLGCYSKKTYLKTGAVCWVYPLGLGRFLPISARFAG